MGLPVTNAHCPCTSSWDSIVASITITDLHFFYITAGQSFWCISFCLFWVSEVFRTLQTPIHFLANSKKTSKSSFFILPYIKSHLKTILLFSSYSVSLIQYSLKSWWWRMSGILRYAYMYFIVFSQSFLDRSLMIGWRKNSWNPERVSSVFTFACFSLWTGYRKHLLT